MNEWGYEPFPEVILSDFVIKSDRNPRFAGGSSERKTVQRAGLGNKSKEQCK